MEDPDHLEELLIRVRQQMTPCWPDIEAAVGRKKLIADLYGGEKGLAFLEKQLSTATKRATGRSTPQTTSGALAKYIQRVTK